MTQIRLKDFPTRAPEGFEKKKTKAKTDDLARRLGDLQHTQYAEGKHAILVIFQGMDSSGKDGATRKVFHYCSPTSVWAYGFKKPTEREMEHDFLWRVHQFAPRKGRIQIFNRSHYEDILVQRVHGWIDMETVEQRMQAINSFEQLLMQDNNTTIIKFYMHISKDRQKEKLQERLDNPRKHWKHKDADWKEREHWDEYMKAYEYVLNRSLVPWHIIPVDQRWYRDHIVAKTMVETMETLDMKRPALKTSMKNGG